ncbi:ATP-binding protein (AAA domain) [Arcobacter venerupis]|uniref:ATP-binding protein (AAA domain) n=1 Tax=Arcobacter venerupis TaxID=1054033 RepID=A0AAE7E3P5_9BACT|nr:ATP-binding protein [Arcobacter venerupis]QKF67463.1 ATP-binding protein (AAA domain) [Arcobacter venerupis]RWS50522.1 hypothetical protein CKA56_03040 [Arcobacter venerupis]
MKIKKVELKYFKFHQDLTINFNGKNVLIYGENGTGKSSIYEALYSNFYHQKRLDKGIDIQETYRNRNFITNDLEINIDFDNEKFLNRNSQELSPFDILNVENLSGKTPLSKYMLIEPSIYFANEKILNRIVKENFYIALNETLFEHFPQMKSKYTSENENHHFKRYSQFNNLEILKKKIIEKSGDDAHKIRDEFEKIIKSENELLQFVFDTEFPTNEINKIINGYFSENLKISFEITPAQSGNSEVLEFYPPIIKIKIDDINCNGKLSQHYNEAKLKLIGVAIYFALAKKYEDKSDNFKLLVLDDFLTSLDMSNRKLIMKYILEEFKDYQKLILTHNLQFFNMTRKMINLDNEEKEQWEVKKLFVYNNQAFLYDKDVSYLKDANDSLKRGDEHSAGNFIRKEFERIVTEFEQLLELGRVEDLQNMIDALKSTDKHYIYSHKLINSFYKKIEEILDNNQSDEIKLNRIKSAFKPLNQTEISFIDKIENEDGTISKDNIQSIIKRGEFYKNFILNSTSHDDSNAEIYKAECENAIKILKYINLIINNLKGTKYE